MTEFPRNLPEPTLPEHELIQQAAPLPELSPEFRGRTLASCQTSIRHAQRRFRLKVAGTMLAAVCLIMLAWLPTDGPTNDSTPQHQAVRQNTTETRSDSDPGNVDQPMSPGESPGELSDRDSATPRRKSGVGLASGEAKPSEDRDLREMIEELKNRTQIFDASMLPRF